MSIILRIILILVSMLTFIFIVKKIRQSKLKMEDSIIWIIGSFLLILMSVFSNVVEIISAKLGFVSPANFVFVTVNFFLIISVFNLSLKMSVLKEKVKHLNHYIALNEYESKKSKEVKKDE